jgi:hypothetical protein
MKCPHCEEELPGSPCTECGETVLEGANYCPECGSPLREELDRTNRDTVSDQDEEFDFESRELCPDGSCTGIIVDGKCSECGKPVADGEHPAAEGAEKKYGEEKEEGD